MVDHARDLDRTFAALIDHTRRAIQLRLRAGAATVTELAQPFDVSLAAVSKHVEVLERAGLVRREIRGREHHCRLEPRPLREAARWIAAYRAFWDARLDALEGFLRRRRAATPARTVR